MGWVGGGGGIGFFFFFFKQKTAYEIYQCDWSSDVCSSDLMTGLLPFLVTTLRSRVSSRTEHSSTAIRFAMFSGLRYGAIFF